MSNRNHEESRRQKDYELARKLAEGVAALRNIKKYGRQSADGIRPQLRFSMHYNFSISFHEHGKRLLVTLAYITKRSSIRALQTRIGETIEQRAPFDFQLRQGCIFLILNPTSKLVFSLISLTVAFIVAPHMPPAVYKRLEILVHENINL